MSCNCNDSTQHSANCPCDGFDHPLPLAIGMGLTGLPRQIASFAEFRRAMLADIRKQYPLQLWQARQPDDLGVMLLEMWAYICDSLSFYDKVIAQEEYVRTALLRPSLRKLVALLGYLPRPAVGSTVYLAAQGDGRKMVKLPGGTAFRSGGFDGNPPQVFEMEDDGFIHPFFNQWRIKPSHLGLTARENQKNFLIRDAVALRPGNLLFIIDTVHAGNFQLLWLEKEEPYTGFDGEIYKKIILKNDSTLDRFYPLANLDLYVFIQTAGVIDFKFGELNSITLDASYREVKTNTFIGISRGYQTRWFRVTAATEEFRQQGPAATVVINENTFSIPPITIKVTKVTLDTAINDSRRKNRHYPQNWEDIDPSDLTVHFAMQPAGTITDDVKTRLSDTDEMELLPKSEVPAEAFRPDTFLLSDKNTRGVMAGGSLHFASSKFILDDESGWRPDLFHPVDLFGNVIKATRGETVPFEILGNGDATVANQTFKLKKKPLTYLPSPVAGNDSGVQNTLTVYVNGVKWKEVPVFYNRKETEEIYIVRQNDEGDSMVIFGDGIRGSRLPNGVDNITATYRVGAGEAAPPAGSVNQISKPVAGLRSVNNPLPASGGDDAEDAGSLRTNAPSSVLVLGRAVSIHDMEAVLLSMPGVSAVQAEWHWHPSRQSPLVHIWYIGEEGLERMLTDRLKNVTDPSMPFVIDPAVQVPATLEIELKIDPRYIIQNVTAALHKLLVEEDKGMLSLKKIGIGQPLFISHIFKAAASIEGVTAVSRILWNGTAFTGFARDPGAGQYFSFEENAIIINGTNA